MNNKQRAIGILSFLLMVAFLYGIFKLEQYKFRDCKKVGHTNLYCILTSGK